MPRKNHFIVDANERFVYFAFAHALHRFYVLLPPFLADVGFSIGVLVLVLGFLGNFFGEFELEGK